MIILFNYGIIVGCYGNFVVMLLMVVILGVGKIYFCVISYVDGFVSYCFMLFSLSFDYWVVIGGEVA